MYVISRRKLREFAEMYQEAEGPLDSWYRTARRATWANLAGVRQTSPYADLDRASTIFNIAGNNYRLIKKLSYNDRVILAQC